MSFKSKYEKYPAWIILNNAGNQTSSIGFHKTVNFSVQTACQRWHYEYQHLSLHAVMHNVQKNKVLQIILPKYTSYTQ